MEIQGKYPVISMTFKDIKCQTWEDCYDALKMTISNEYRRHRYILDSDIIDEYEKIVFAAILNLSAGNVDYESSIKNLSKYLARYHKTKVIILIDEYDIPIQSGYLCKYFDKVIAFMRNFLSGACKDNENLEKSVLTGILKVAKESIFSGLNNLNVCTVLSTHYSDKFGFVEEEVEEMMRYYKIEAKINDVKTWYNGYIFGEDIIYNPWSILNYINNWKLGFKAHWVNTSSNDLVKELITNGGIDLKTELEQLIKGETILKEISEDIVMGEMSNDSNAVWSFLLFCGYLKVVGTQVISNDIHYFLKIPNLEVESLFKHIILGWSKIGLSGTNYQLMLKSLVTGDIEVFDDIFCSYVESSLSYFDVGGKEPEKFYHAFVLGLLVSLNESHEVKSNRESSFGRYDVMVIPKNKDGIGIVMEFKKVNKKRKEDIEMAVDAALLQIEKKNYRQELRDRGIGEIIEIGMAFDGKEVLLRDRRV
jgi:hypothetical protein